MRESHEHSTPDVMQIRYLNIALTIATRSRIPPVSGAIHLILDVPPTADNHSHIYAAPAFIHVNPMRKTNSCDLCRSADYSVISEELRRQLNVPMFTETGPILKTACGKPVAASGRLH
ncbi:hypothetical protein AVEN_210252-1 [Araneus ventricosus]|uniref:Uncharacterized protein n=1 Tax=Araneus ventricosus TaxID=182803 RepID=A0A4Y2FYS4_ARAVE|nr:hypothetical protein AVEN_210252-1 [Araneus ventricosus]